MGVSVAISVNFKEEKGFWVKLLSTFSYTFKVLGAFFFFFFRISVYSSLVDKNYIVLVYYTKV
jgi:hypothetical protein